MATPNDTPRTTGRRPGISPGSDEALHSTLPALRCTGTLRARVIVAARRAGLSPAEWRRQALAAALDSQ